MPADLSIAKNTSATAVTVGQQFHYTITVTNNGPNAATDVIITDDVPAGLCLNAVAISPETGYYTYTGNAIKWTIPSLGNAASAVMTVTVTACSPGTLYNTGTVTAAESDPVPANNSTTAHVTVTGSAAPAADLALWKESPAAVSPGTSFNYILSAINNGPDTAYGVVVTDTLPPGLVPQEVTASPVGAGTISGNTVTVHIGTMHPNDRVQITIRVLPTVADAFQNTASITGDGTVPDPNPGNNTATAITTVEPAADLGITKTASAATAVVGDTLTYTVTVTNYGPSAASTVVVTDRLPTTVTILSIAASQGSGCTPLGSNEYLCQLGTLPAGDAATVTITVRPDETGFICNSATVSSGTADPNPGNNDASLCTYVKRPEIDLAVTKIHAPEPATVCAPITFTITVANNGPAPATGVVLLDQLPSAFEVLSVCASQGQCRPPHGCPGNAHDNCDGGCVREIVCRLGTLAAGASASVDLCVRPCRAGTFTNTAIVTANEDEQNPDNNQAVDTVTVLTPGEQTDRLTAAVNDLAAAGQIPADAAAALLSWLQQTQGYILCGSPAGAAHALANFINAVTDYMRRDILSAEAGCSMLRTAEAIRAALHCLQTCGPTWARQGDDRCVPD